MARRNGGEVAAAFERSGLTQAEFCRRENVSKSVLQYHLKKHGGAAPTFVPVGTSTQIEIEAANGIKIRLSGNVDSAVLRRVLEAAGARA